MTNVLALTFYVQPARASAAIYIRADGSVDPPTAPITTVDNITYTLTGNVSDSIVVERDSIIVDGQGYAVQGTGSGEAIHLSGRSNVTIKNTEIKAFNSGILLYDSSNNSIWGNNIAANSYDGILLLSSSNNTISENNITENSLYGLRFFSSSNNIARRNHVANNWYGICLEEESSDNTFRDNSMTGNKFSFHVSSWSLSGYVQDVDVSNIVDGKPICYWISEHDMVVPANAGYVAIVNCTRITVAHLNPKGVLLAYTVDSTITNNSMANNEYGVYFAFSSNNRILENNITNNEYGIWFDFPSSNNIISRNNITASNFRDIWLSGSSNNTISGNNVNDGMGILLRDSYENSIHSNEITNSEYGIVLWYSSTNRVYRNNIRNSTSAGILLTYSQNNNLSENKIIDSYEGIWLEFSTENTISGNLLENNAWGIHTWYSPDNEIYHNNFVHNTQQVLIEESIGAWDDGFPSGGNYWSNYVGSDVYGGAYQNETGSDGIGDTYYVIDLDNADHYPLMQPWTPAIPEFAGTAYIRADGSIDPPDAPFSTTDNVTYTLTGNVTSDMDGIVIERDNVTVDGMGYAVHGSSVDESKGICLDGRNNVTIKNMEIRGFSYGIWLNSSTNNVMSGNNIKENNWYGIYLYASSNCNSVSGNNITNNEYGIWQEYSSNNGISGNTITGNVQAGVFLFGYSSNNTINENNVTNNGIGIYLLDHSSYNEISENNITGNDYGIWLLSDCSDNTISGNNIIGNYWHGIHFYYSSDNFIFHNNFVDNSNQVYMEGSANIWDDGYPSGGNYWSGYQGNDSFIGLYQNVTGSDGIGDAPYIVDAVSSDRYPLMIPWRNLVGDLNKDGKVDLKDIAMVARAFGSIPGSSRWNALADLNGDQRIDVRDIV